MTASSGKARPTSFLLSSGLGLSPFLIASLSVIAVADTVKFMTNTTKAVPAPVLKRLTDYYATIQGLRAEGVEWVSSSEVADALGLTSSTVRQDLSHLNFAGVSKRGYETSGLETALARALGADKIWNMLVVGAGNLGRALALHQAFRRRVVTGVKEFTVPVGTLFFIRAHKLFITAASVPLRRLLSFRSKCLNLILSIGKSTIHGLDRKHIL